MSACGRFELATKRCSATYLNGLSRHNFSSSLALSKLRVFYLWLELMCSAQHGVPWRLLKWYALNVLFLQEMKVAAAYGGVAEVAVSKCQTRSVGVVVVGAAAAAAAVAVAVVEAERYNRRASYVSDFGVPLLAVSDWRNH